MNLMSRTMNLPQISKILQDFERESSAMDMKEEMMSDTVDEVMEDEAETEEEESDKILKQVLDEIGVGLSQQVRRRRHVSCLPASFLHQRNRGLNADFPCTFTYPSLQTNDSSERRRLLLEHLLQSRRGGKQWQLGKVV